MTRTDGAEVEQLIDIDLGTDSPSPDIALLLYGELGLATVHRINSGFGFNSGPTIGEGRMVLQDDLEALARILTENRGTSSYILGDRVLGIGSNWLTWYSPATVRPMLFRFMGKDHHLNVLWPNLIFHASAGRLYAAAYVGGERPGPGTLVYLPPLQNFYDSTAMCPGGARYPSSYGEHTIPAWEAAVFDTYFSHTNGSQKIAGCADDEGHIRFWSHPARRRYPLKARHLIPISWAPTTGEWLNSLHDG